MNWFSKANNISLVKAINRILNKIKLTSMPILKVIKTNISEKHYRTALLNKNPNMLLYKLLKRLPTTKIN